MECKDVSARIESYLDGELTLSDKREVEKHLPACPACQARLENLRALHVGINSLSSEHVPASLKKNIHLGLKDVTGEDNRSGNLFGWLGFSGGAMALVSVIVWAMISVTFVVPQQSRISEEIITAHVRSLLVDHATDVISTDSHTVKPWFNGKLDFSPQVKNFAAQGFALQGGRLEYINNRTSSALVYKRRAHIINVFIMRSDNAEQADSSTLISRQGFNVYQWTTNGLAYWVVSDLNKTELHEFKQLLQQS